MKLTEISVLSAIVVVTCSIKFLFDGVSLDLLGHSVNFGHIEPSAYLGILTPVLGAHGWIKGRSNEEK